MRTVTMVSLVAMAIFFNWCGGANAGAILFADNFDSATAGTLPTTADLDPTATTGSWLIKNESLAETFQVVNNETPDSISAGTNQYLHAFRDDGVGSELFATGWTAGDTDGKTIQLSFSSWLSDSSSSSCLVGFTSHTDYAGRSFGVYMYGDGSVKFYSENTGTFISTGLVAETGIWQDVVVTANMAARTFSIKVDDQTPYTGAFWTSTATTVANVLVTPTVFDHASSFDNVQLMAIPEPSTMALLTTGVLGLVAYAWRKRR